MLSQTMEGQIQREMLGSNIYLILLARAARVFELIQPPTMHSL